MTRDEAVEKLNECTKKICEFKRLYEVDSTKDSGFAMCEWMTNRIQLAQLMKVQGRISGQGIMDVLEIKHDIGLGQAAAFGEGYTRGKYGMSRAEYNVTAKMSMRCWKCHKRYTIPRPEKTSAVTCVCPDCGDEFDTEIHGMRENLENENG